MTVDKKNEVNMAAVATVLLKYPWAQAQSTHLGNTLIRLGCTWSSVHSLQTDQTR